ncbi:MAG: energy transducer TonB [Sphingomonas sp.]|nr:energy transducer TonB [Sphingomonas sp.]
MASYRGNQRQDRAKALAAVALVHAALGAIILTGLDVRIVEQTVERLQTFDITPEAPPPPIPEPPPPPKLEESSAPEDEAAPANIKSRPTPVVAPKPPIPLPIPVPINTSNIRGPEGLDRTAGASNVPGLATGAGGRGSGFGGGGMGGSGAGSGSGIGREARLLGGNRARLSSSFLRSVGLRRGAVPLHLKIGARGHVTACRPLRSSGSSTLDAELCRIMTSHSRWSPAADRAGRPISIELTYTATFSE